MNTKTSLILTVVLSIVPMQGMCGLLADGVIRDIQQGTADTFTLTIVGTGICASPQIVTFQRSDFQAPGRSVTSFDRIYQLALLSATLGTRVRVIDAGSDLCDDPDVLNALELN